VRPIAAQIEAIARPTVLVSVAIGQAIVLATARIEAAASRRIPRIVVAGMLANEPVLAIAPQQPIAPLQSTVGMEEGAEASTHRRVGRLVQRRRAAARASPRLVAAVAAEEVSEEAAAAEEVAAAVGAELTSCGAILHGTTAKNKKAVKMTKCTMP
jgi:hypothetical protein